MDQYGRQLCAESTHILVGGITYQAKLAYFRVGATPLLVSIYALQKIQAIFNELKIQYFKIVAKSIMAKSKGAKCFSTFFWLEEK